MIKNLCNVILKLEKHPRKIIREKPSEAKRFFDINNEGIVIH
jgi:hypothetical protein